MALLKFPEALELKIFEVIAQASEELLRRGGRLDRCDRHLTEQRVECSWVPWFPKEQRPKMP